jgi:hypothetical protein
MIAKLGWLPIRFAAVAVQAATVDRGPRLKVLRQDLLLVCFDEVENKALIAEFDRFLVVIEAPRNDEIGRKILEVARQRFPGKPVRRLMFADVCGNGQGGGAARGSRPGRGQAGPRMGPGEALESANRALHGEGSADRFVSAIVARIDTRRGRVQVASAGT